MRAATSSAWATLRWVGCGFSRNASTIKHSTPEMFCAISSGTALQSLRYAIRLRPERENITGKWIGPFESEEKNALEVGHGFSRGVDWHRTALPGKTPQIVEAHDMVGVRMSENDGVDATNIFPQGLGAEIRSGIDDESGLGCFDVHGRTEAFIARVGGMTNRAIAPDHRNALRCSGAEKSENEFGVESCG